MQSKTRRRDILLLLADVARLLKTYIDRRAAEHGMTRAQWGALARIERCGGLMQAEIAEQMDLQPISLVPILDKLSEQGLIERRASHEDRRAKLLFLTPKGKAVLDELEPLADAIAAEVLGGLAPDSVPGLQEALARIKTDIKRASEQPRAHAQAQIDAKP